MVPRERKTVAPCARPARMRNLRHAAREKLRLRGKLVAILSGSEIAPIETTAAGAPRSTRGDCIAAHVHGPAERGLADAPSSGCGAHGRAIVRRAFLRHTNPVTARKPVVAGKIRRLLDLPCSVAWQCAAVADDVGVSRAHRQNFHSRPAFLLASPAVRTVVQPANPGPSLHLSSPPPVSTAPRAPSSHQWHGPSGRVPA